MGVMVGVRVGVGLADGVWAGSILGISIVVREGVGAGRFPCALTIMHWPQPESSMLEMKLARTRSRQISLTTLNRRLIKADYIA